MCCLFQRFIRIFPNQSAYFNNKLLLFLKLFRNDFRSFSLGKLLCYLSKQTKVCCYRMRSRQQPSAFYVTADSS